MDVDLGSFLKFQVKFPKCNTQIANRYHSCKKYMYIVCIIIIQYINYGNMRLTFCFILIFSEYGQIRFDGLKWSRGLGLVILCIIVSQRFGPSVEKR